MNKTIKTTICSIAACLCISLSAQGQIAKADAPVQLLGGVQSEMYYPVLSADGTQLLFSDANYANLRHYSFTDNVTRLVDRDVRSGLEARFTPDGKSVVYVAQQTDANGLNMRTVRSFDLTSGTKTDIAAPARMATRPRMSKTDVRTEGSTLYITVDGSEHAYQPAGECAAYLWESLSPDKTKVMFVAAGKGIYITDLKGNVLSRPGKYEAPVWYGNDVIVAQNATDDGHQLHSSQIMLIKADGSQTQALTRPESMTMFPTASYEAGRIVYNTIDGRLYMINLTIL